jgi:hypothetical protein
MNDSLMGMGIGGQEISMPICIDASPTMLQKLNREKSRLEEKLGKVNTAILALEKNPEIQGILEAVRQAM